jgi:solute carrier family 25 (mitochondrial S-adenosylmethionine transporter), member 26
MDGPRGFWRGLGPQMLRDVPFAVVMFVVYETLARRTSFRGFVSGAVAGVTASALTAPLDLLKTRAMTNVGRRTPMLQEVAAIWKTEGPGTFWKGSCHRIVYKMASSAVFFAALEMYQKMFRLHAQLPVSTRAKSI